MHFLTVPLAQSLQAELCVNPLLDDKLEDYRLETGAPRITEEAIHEQLIEFLYSVYAQ